MTTTWPDLITEATAFSTAVLDKCTDQDWSRPAGELEWSCYQTISHLTQAVFGYSALLIARPTDRYIGLRFSVDEGTPPELAVEGIRIGGALLNSTLRETGPDVRAYHPWGTGDAAGYGAMHVLEVLVHSRDIAQGFGLDQPLPDELCAPTVERLFPQAPAGFSPSETLLWCTGRAELPGLGRQKDWRWYADVR
ncbi:maleylpyruvate isomerase N-terminal domain-containing protein [Streptomyces sp. NPDC057011]|uniref:maleylpyruvate isomerase N-terminal domain-containing protein n=1 Tax=unclassified Streptomyces TaxID=2593676 RepID=UPI00363869F7